MNFTASRVYSMINEHNEVVLCFVCENAKESLNAYSEIKDFSKINVEAKKWREKRSRSANSYMWVLLDKMAKTLANGETKETLYQAYVKENGYFNFIDVPNKDVESVIRGWKNNGLGWHAEIFRQSKTKDCTVLLLIYGSSHYDSKQMSELINAIVVDAQEMGIETKTPLEIADMLSLYNEESNE